MILGYTNSDLFENATGYVFRSTHYPKQGREGKSPYENYILDINYGLTNNYGTEQGLACIVLLKVVSNYVDFISG